MPTTVHLLRHGEVFNPDGILYGRLPGFPLSERGRAMASAAASALAGVTNLVSSPLTRAQETAQPISQAFGLPIVTDPRLIEAGSVFEGHPIVADKWQLAAPRYWKYYRNPCRPSWGEPFSQIAARLTGAIRSVLPTIPDGGAAVLVSHQLPIWIARRFLEGRPLVHNPLSRQCNLASLTTLTFEGATLVGLSYSEPAAHLYQGAADWAPGARK